MKTIRCAIYTRKSSDEGLEQAFNSLDAQREACAAYILSQASEGWSALPDVYDDGGLSGGTLERPALQRLLTEVRAGRIDIIVVYKVDRLTRSLLDFAKLVEAFDSAGTSFVSVTQSFNTTTSMGRLTLNMLLSFAQFEREVTAERIRDKIAASKAKGMWMGGTPPLGYRPDGRSLAIVDEHAALVRDIYRGYLELGNVRLLADRLAREGRVSPTRATAGGRPFGGGGFTRGQLYALLKNPIYAGDVAHRGQLYAGQHSAIIERETWNVVQERLAEHLVGERRSARAVDPSLLAGLLFDEAGDPLVAAHACKGKVRYRYYVSRALQHAEGNASGRGIRLPAREIEAAVAARLADALDDPLKLAPVASINIAPTQLHQFIERAGIAAAEIRSRNRDRVRKMLVQVRMLPDGMEIDLSVQALADEFDATLADDAAEVVTLTSAMRLTRSGRALRLVQNDGSRPGSSSPDPSLVRLLLKALRWWAQLRRGEVDVQNLAEREGVTPSYITRVVRLAFLAPEVVDALLAGHLRHTLDGSKLTAPAAIPAAWVSQRSLLLPSQRTQST